MEKKRDRCGVAWQRPLLRAQPSVFGDRLGRVTTRQLVNGSLASPVWPDCVADHTYDDMWLIHLSDVATVQKKRTAAATAGGARTPNSNKPDSVTILLCLPTITLGSLDGSY